MSHSLAAGQTGRRASAIYAGWHLLRQYALKPALDLIFPPVCVGCGKVDMLLCDTCLASFAPAEAEAALPPLAALQAVGIYQGHLQQAVHALKYDLLTDLAQPLGVMMACFIQNAGWPHSTLVPVPLHDQRLRARGFNQAALLGRVIGGQLGWPQVEQALIRTRNTSSQVGLDRQQRQNNVKNAFTLANPVGLLENDVVLVDDVFTTGATIRECAVTLLDSGIRSVRAIVVGRALSADQR